MDKIPQKNANRNLRKYTKREKKRETKQHAAISLFAELPTSYYFIRVKSIDSHFLRTRHRLYNIINEMYKRDCEKKKKIREIMRAIVGFDELISDVILSYLEWIPQHAPIRMFVLGH